jgi:hypothetical protein
VKAGLQRLCFYRLRSLQACRMDNGAANGDVAIRGTRDLSPLSQGLPYSVTKERRDTMAHLTVLTSPEADSACRMIDRL